MVSPVFVLAKINAQQDGKGAASGRQRSLEQALFGFIARPAHLRYVNVVTFGDMFIKLFEMFYWRNIVLVWDLGSVPVYAIVAENLIPRAANSTIRFYSRTINSTEKANLTSVLAYFHERSRGISCD